MVMASFYQNQSPTQNIADSLSLFETCLNARLNDASLKNTQAYRLFNGFYEGFPGLIVDRFARTLLIKNFARQPQSLEDLIQPAVDFYKKNIPDINAVLLKTRHAKEESQRVGQIIEGEPDQEILENGILYSLDLQLNQDDSFYLDTRNLRQWLSDNMKDKTLLNTFAYTGALGIAALASGASRVIQTDLNAKYLQIAKNSATLQNTTNEHQILAGDFFKQMARFKNQNILFDAIIIDPPLYSKTQAGEVSLLNNWQKLVNKVRPLVADEGHLILINNALYLPSETLYAQIQKMCETGYMEIEEIIDIPQDIIGYSHTIKAHPQIDTKPYNHPTKITITRVKRKDGRRASQF